MTENIANIMVEKDLKSQETQRASNKMNQSGTRQDTP